MGDRLTGSDLIGLLKAVSDAIEAEKGRLSELDGVIGDADHGVTMSIGFTAVSNALDDLPTDAEPTLVFNTTAKTFLNAVGASAGPLYATAFMRAGAAVKGKADLDAEAMSDVIAAMAKGVQDRGKAEPGEKTMVDAWHPAAQAMASVDGLATAELLSKAADAALAGAEATKDMIATKGRSAKLGDRVLGHIDPGAASTAVILRAMADAVSNQNQ